MVHPQYALAQPLVINRGSIYLAILVDLSYVVLSNLILLNGNIPIGPKQQYLMDQVVLMHLVRLSFLLVLNRRDCLLLRHRVVIVYVLFTTILVVFLFLFTIVFVLINQNLKQV